MYGRGISDNKGHIVSRMLAIDALLAVDGELPCHVKFAIEGEEETGSPNMRAFVEANREKLAAEVCIWESGGVNHLEIPIQYLGWRGICFVELRVQTANTDLHSGLGGSIFPNAAWRLVWALNSLKNEQEHVQIKGFYDPVMKPSELDWELMSRLPEVADEYRSRGDRGDRVTHQPGFRTLLHNLRADLRLPGERYENYTPCPGQREDRFSLGPQSNPGTSARAIADPPRPKWVLRY
jgi:acetylornithine deacetylase/succinyl-diaminopimelate desuccinylase-like protein